MTWSELCKREPALNQFDDFAREAGRAGSDCWHDGVPKWVYVEFLHLFLPDGAFGSQSTAAWEAALRHLNQTFVEAAA